jgi:hypothetical protein
MLILLQDALFGGSPIQHVLRAEGHDATRKIARPDAMLEEVRPTSMQARECRDLKAMSVIDCTSGFGGAYQDAASQLRPR